MASWSDLAPDVIERITSYLCLELPWIVLTEDRETRKRKLFNMSEQRHYYIDLPELRGGFCVGSSFGWLFIVSPKIEGYLVNPFSRARYLFPPLPLYSEDFNLDQFVDGFTFEIYDRSITWDINRLQKLNISKAVLSDDPSKCNNFVTMIIVNGLNRMAFCRPKDSAWTIIHDGPKIDDMICYKGNFHALGGCNSLYAVYLGSKPKMLTIRPRVFTGESRYLVDYFGEHLLLVHRNKVKPEEQDEDPTTDTDTEQDEDPYTGTDTEQDEDGDDKDPDRFHYVTNFFVVFEHDLEKEAWCEWNDLGGNALFLGTNRSIAIRASEFPGCKADCIYFTSDSTDVLVTEKYGYSDLGIYNLVEDSMEEIYEDYIPNTSLKTWLVPNP